MTPKRPAPCTLLHSLSFLGAWPKATLQSILLSRIIQQECMCIFDIVSPLEGRPSGCDPCPLQGRRRSPEKEPFVPGGQFFHSPYGPKGLPCSAWACRSPAISTWAGGFRAMHKAVRPAYGGKKRRNKFYPVCIPPQKVRGNWE